MENISHKVLIEEKLKKVIEMIHDFFDAGLMDTRLKNEFLAVPVLFLGALHVPYDDNKTEYICNMAGLKIDKDENYMIVAERVADTYTEELLQILKDVA